MPGYSNVSKARSFGEIKRKASNSRTVRRDKYHPNCVPKTDDGSENIKKITKNSEISKQKFIGGSGSGKREVMKLVTHDMIREIIIPKEDNVKAVVFDSSRFRQLKDKSVYLTDKEKQEQINKAKDKKAKEAAESALRKKKLQEYDTCREHGSHLSELEEEANKRANHLLLRAFELRQEQEDEIKKCNALILGTKCHAIRDAQIAEKALILKELEEEDKRLEMMMEEERLKAVREQEKRKEREAMKKKAFTQAILEQIQENEMQREMIAESTEEEARLANEAAMQAQLDEIKAYQQKREEQTRLCEEMNLINQQLQKIAATEREENRLADLKVQEFMRRKAEQDKAKEEEVMQLKLAKEKELARLRAMQERAADVQAQKDEMTAQRIQDEVEREWRRKEREAALRRVQENENLKKARQQQVEDRRRCQALEIQREKEEAEKIAQVNLAAIKRDHEEEMRRLCAIDEHRMALLKQINEKETERIRSRQEQFQEGVAIKMEEKKRTEMLRDTMMKKMSLIRSHQVPEKYVREVERQLKLLE